MLKKRREKGHLTTEPEGASGAAKGNLVRVTRRAKPVKLHSHAFVLTAKPVFPVAWLAAGCPSGSGEDAPSSKRYCKHYSIRIFTYRNRVHARQTKKIKIFKNGVPRI